MDRGHILAILHQIQRWSELSCPAVSNIAGGSWDTPVFVGLRDRWPWGFFGHAALEDQRAVWGCSEGRKNSAETSMEVEEKSPKDELRMFSSLGCLQNWRIKERIAQVIFDLFETWGSKFDKVWFFKWVFQPHRDASEVLFLCLDHWMLKLVPC